MRRLRPTHTALAQSHICFLCSNSRHLDILQPIIGICLWVTEQILVLKLFDDTTQSHREVTYPRTHPRQSSSSLQTPGFLGEGHSPANWGVWASALRGRRPFHTDSPLSCTAPAAETLGRCLTESGEKKTTNIKYRKQKGLFFNCKISSSHQRITTNNNLANLRDLLNDNVGMHN